MTSTPPTTRRDDELVYDDTPAPPGRPVRLVPTPDGFWRVAGGIIVVAVALITLYGGEKRLHPKQRRAGEEMAVHEAP